MIEGKVKLELFDGLTGKCQEKIESHNMMTGAIDKIVQFIMRHPYRGTRNYESIYGQHLHLLQGLCLFDSVLPENANQIWLPAGVKPTAYGVVGQANNSDNAKMLGTYNPTESDTDPTFVKKYVWDWGTQQGNGVTASLGLTHYSAGFFGFGGNQQGAENNAGFGQRSKMIGLASICERPKNISKAVPYSYWNSQWQNIRYVGTVGSDYLDMCIDAENDYKYMYQVSVNGLSVIRHKMNFEHFDIFRSVTDWQEYDEENYTAEFTGGSNFRGFYNTDEKKLYFWLDDGRNVYDSGYSCTIYYYDITNKTVGTHGTFTTSIGGLGTDLVVTNSAIYCHTYYSNPWVYKYSFQTGAMTECSGQATASYSNGQPPMPKNYILNGIITMPFAKQGFSTPADILIDTSDDSVRYTVCGFQQLYGYHRSSYGSSRWEGYIPLIPPYDNTQVAFGYGALDSDYSSGYPNIGSFVMKLEDGNVESSSQGFCDTFAPCNYLGTIFNLSEAVTKTAQQTMKLTYTLTAHEEEGE